MNIEIANRLVQLRKQHGYSQEELAAKAHNYELERCESPPGREQMGARGGLARHR